MDQDQPVASGSGSSNTTASNRILNILLTLPITHPSLLELISSHRPFSHPSHLPAAASTKFLNRLNTSILGKDDVETRRSGCQVAKEVIRQDEEGWVLSNWGKNWLGSCLNFVSNQTTPLNSVTPSAQLIQSIVLAAKGFPGFERDAILPIQGKLAVTCTKLLERCINSSERVNEVLYDLLICVTSLIHHSPAPWRPSIPHLRPLLTTVILHAPTPPSTSPIPYPDEVRMAAADLYACLHLAAGKAASSQSWTSDLKDALGGLGSCISAITADGFQESPYRPPPTTSSTSSLPPLPVDPSTRLSLALEFLEGYTEILLSLLRFSTTRPVSIPISYLVNTSLRMLNLTLDTPMVEYISPIHSASLTSCLPRLWTSALLILAATGAAVRDNLFPHISEIMDHTVFLSETIPSSMTEVHVQLLRFHLLWLELYPASILPIEYISRLLKLSLGKLSPLLNDRPMELSPTENGSGKRGKKRARGMEDALVGGLEGKTASRVGNEEGEIVLAALKLIPHLHRAALLPPALLTFSVRLHLSIYLQLPELYGRFVDLAMEERDSQAVAHVLEEAVLLSEEEGTMRGWKSIILGLLDAPRDRFNLLLHPSIPPLHRPAPPLASLHYFALETEDEKRIRQEMGFATSSDLNQHDHNSAVEEEDGTLDHQVQFGHHVLQKDIPSITVVAPPKDRSPSPIRIDSEPNPSFSAPTVNSDEALIAPPGVPSILTSSQLGPTPSIQSEQHHNAGADAGFTAIVTIPHPATTTHETVQNQNHSVVHGSNKTLSSIDPPKPQSERQLAQLAQDKDEDDEGIPELDSGSSDEDAQGDDDEDDENMDEE